MGFTLGITNAPAGAALWNGNFAEKSFDYDPIADSGWLGIDKSWVYPSDPRGCTSLHIWILDANNNILLNVYNLGPLNDGKDYTYDCSTGVLGEVVAPEVVPCEISIDAPDSAVEGETVNVAAIIRNVSAYDYSYKTEIYAEATLLLRTDNIITSGASRGYITSFIMPARDITILVWVERWAVDHWIYDNSASKAISLEVVPEYRGTIITKELEYDGARGNIPVY